MTDNLRVLRGVRYLQPKTIEVLRDNDVIMSRHEPPRIALFGGTNQEFATWIERDLHDPETINASAAPSRNLSTNTMGELTPVHSSEYLLAGYSPDDGPAYEDLRLSMEAAERAVARWQNK